MTYNWDQEEPYDQGNAWGHFALKVTDVYATADYLKSQGVEFTREPGPMKGGTRLIAFFKDPNGYVIELNEPLATAGQLSIHLDRIKLFIEGTQTNNMCEILR